MKSQLTELKFTQCRIEPKIMIKRTIYLLHKLSREENRKVWLQNIINYKRYSKLRKLTLFRCQLMRIYSVSFNCYISLFYFVSTLEKQRQHVNYLYKNNQLNRRIPSGALSVVSSVVCLNSVSLGRESDKLFLHLNVI